MPVLKSLLLVIVSRVFDKELNMPPMRKRSSVGCERNSKFLCGL